jgi:GxxExxY protein
MASVPHQEVTYRIIGCAMAVHNELGPGLREGIYQRALAVKMEQAGLAQLEEKAIEIYLDGACIGLLYLDHLVEDLVVVEIKALRHLLTNDEVGQVITYLAATGYPVGLLLNFAGKSLEYKRIFPPRKLDAWRNRIQRYIWRLAPPADARRAVHNPLIRSSKSDVRFAGYDDAAAFPARSPADR